jgi:murein L,D-transpeptidase YafK
VIQLLRAGITALFIGLLTAFAPGPASFKLTQLKYNRVQSAYLEKESIVRQLFADKQLDLATASIYLRAFKQDQELEVWAKAPGQSQYRLVTTYSVCARSGGLGPKRRKGDLQTPEGFYFMDRFNPQSTYYLSLGINYPNASDRILGGKSNLGGDIFIHGSCVTVGCLPLTDDKIKELYLIMVEARAGGQQQIPVHIFPTRLTTQNFNRLSGLYSDKPELTRHWQNLKEGYEFFERTKRLPKVGVRPDGSYTFTG